jgi:hypothetical protein
MPVLGDGDEAEPVSSAEVVSEASGDSTFVGLL